MVRFAALPGVGAVQPEPGGRRRRRAGRQPAGGDLGAGGARRPEEARDGPSGRRRGGRLAGSHRGGEAPSCSTVSAEAPSCFAKRRIWDFGRGLLRRPVDEALRLREGFG